MQALGLAVILIGLQMALSGKNLLATVGCLLLGAITGDYKRHARMNETNDVLLFRLHIISSLKAGSFHSRNTSEQNLQAEAQDIIRIDIF